MADKEFSFEDNNPDNPELESLTCTTTVQDKGKKIEANTDCTGVKKQ